MIINKCEEPGHKRSIRSFLSVSIASIIFSTFLVFISGCGSIDEKSSETFSDSITDNSTIPDPAGKSLIEIYEVTVNFDQMTINFSPVIEKKKRISYKSRITSDLRFKSAPDWDSIQKILSGSIALTNSNSFSTLYNAELRIQSVTPSSITVLNEDGITGNNPYLNFGTVESNGGTSVRILKFHDPSSESFSFVVNVYADRLSGGDGVFTEDLNFPAGFYNTRSILSGEITSIGKRDILTGNFGELNRLLVNQGGTSFIDESASRIPSVYLFTSSVKTADIDGDGDRDIVEANSTNNPYNTVHILVNNGNGVFADESASRINAVYSRYTQDVVLQDIDDDGDLDLFICNSLETNNRILINNGNGFFTDESASRIPIAANKCNKAEIADFSGDDKYDIFLAEDGGSQFRILINNGSGVFTDETSSRLPADSANNFDICSGDFDGDGDRDIFIANENNNGNRDKLLINNGSGIFTDESAARLPQIDDFSLGCTTADFDNDNDLDIFIANYGVQNRLYLNNGSGVFTDATSASLPPDNSLSLDAASADIDGNGTQDIVVGNNGRNLLLLN